MSVLEIILYSTLGIATLTYVTICIVKWTRRKKHKDSEEE